MKNLSIFEPQIEKHHAYKKKTGDLYSGGIIIGGNYVLVRRGAYIQGKLYPGF